MTQPTKNLENTMDANDEKCHKMQQFMLEQEGHGQEIRALVNALRKIGYFQRFQGKDNALFSGEKRQKTREKKLKRRKKARYRKIRKYYKSPRQYQKERLRRKLCWLLSGKYTESEIAEMLGISRRTVIRDMNKIKPYYFRLSRSYFRKLQQEKWRKLDAQLEGASLKQRMDVLTEAMAQQRKLWNQHEYKRHYQIILLDLTQPDQYGIPKVTFIPKGRQTLAYPYEVRVHVKGCYNGREFTADIGGFNIVQTSRSRW